MYDWYVDDFFTYLHVSYHPFSSAEMFRADIKTLSFELSSSFLFLQRISSFVCDSSICCVQYIFKNTHTISRSVNPQWWNPSFDILTYTSKLDQDIHIYTPQYSLYVCSQIVWPYKKKKLLFIINQLWMNGQRDLDESCLLPANFSSMELRRGFFGLGASGFNQDLLYTAEKLG